MPPVFLERAGQRIEVPAILLDSGHPPTPADAGDARLHVAARDPNWLYVHWELTREHQLKLNAGAKHGHLIVRVHPHELNREPASENHVHPQSRHWFAHVDTAGINYYVELGRYVGSTWERVAHAGPISTPGHRFAADTSATYLTLDPDRPLAEQLEFRRSGDTSSKTIGSPTAFSESDHRPPDWSPHQQFAVLCALGVVPEGQMPVEDVELAGAEWQGLDECIFAGPGSLGGAFGAGLSGGDALAQRLPSALTMDLPCSFLPDLPHSPK